MMIYPFKMLVFHRKLVDDQYIIIYIPTFSSHVFPSIIPSSTDPKAYVDGEGRVKVSPMIYGRQEDALYLHGHVSAGVLRNGDPAAEWIYWGKTWVWRDDHLRYFSG